MTPKLKEANLENCIYCGACFRYCVLDLFNELDGDGLKELVAGAVRIARKGYDQKRDEKIKSFLDRCVLKGDCDRVCPAMVKPSLRNQIAKNRIGGK